MKIIRKSYLLKFYWFSVYGVHLFLSIICIIKYSSDITRKNALTTSMMIFNHNIFLRYLSDLNSFIPIYCIINTQRVCEINECAILLEVRVLILFKFNTRTTQTLNNTWNIIDISHQTWQMRCFHIIINFINILSLMH